MCLRLLKEKTLSALSLRGWKTAEEVQDEEECGSGGRRGRSGDDEEDEEAT